jgi:siderophore synthetase component
MVQKLSTDSYLNISKGKLDQEELRIHQFLKEQYPKLADTFKRFIAKGRKSILDRLVSSFFRENVLNLAIDSSDLQMIDTVDHTPKVEEHWRKIIGSFGLDKDKNYKVYPLYDNEHLIIPVSCTYGFGRLEIIGDILHVSGERIKKIDHPVELLALFCRKEELTNGNQQSQWTKLADELQNGSANLALSYAYWEKKKEKFHQHACQCGVKSIIEYVLLQKQEDETFDSALFFEQLTIEGHNLHPGTKTKMGMDSQSVYQYSPEFEGKPDVRLVGIRQDYPEWSQVDDSNEANTILFTDHSGVKEIITQEFQKKGLIADEYVFVPVHPWQAENVIPDIYSKELKDQIVVSVDSIRIPSGATSSFRTVVPFADNQGEKLVMKLAVHSQMTSTIRSISTNTTHNAPIFTRLLLEIMQREPELAKIFVPVYEVAGYNFKVAQNEDSSGIRTLKSRNLSAVLRENVESLIDKDEVAIVGSSLYAESPITGKPILVELIEIYAQSIGEGSLREATFQFLSEYVHIAISGYLTLMVKYGVGLEGHMQNSIPVFKNGRPLKMLFWDWGGARIFVDRLSTCGITTSFIPGSITVTDNIKEMHNKVFYTLFQNHLGEIILLIRKHFGLNEQVLWEEIIRICDKIFYSLQSKRQFVEHVCIDREALYQKHAYHKALTKMRLESENKDYSYIKVPNPLYRKKSLRRI